MSIPESLNILVLIIHSHTHCLNYYTVINNDLYRFFNGGAFRLFMFHCKLGIKIMYFTMFKFTLFYDYCHIYSQNLFFKYSLTSTFNSTILSCTNEITIIFSIAVNTIDMLISAGNYDLLEIEVKNH